MRIEGFSQLERWLSRGASQVHCVFCDTPRELPAIVEGLAERASLPFSVVSIHDGQSAGLAERLEQAVQVLAEAVLARRSSLGQSAAAQLQTFSTSARAAPIPPRIPAGWWQRTLDACRAGQVPRCRELALIVEAERLSLCLDPERLVLVWVAPPTELSGAALLGFARAVEWLANATRASVLVALHSDYAHRPELDAINYESLRCASTSVPHDDGIAIDARSGGGTPPDGPAPDLHRPHVAGAADVAPGGGASTALPRERARAPRVTGLWPVIGQPHPLSPAEQRFAEVLAADEELAPAFCWNQAVATTQNTNPIVDLVCERRRLVVEIDGFAHHSSRHAFERDRQRDWELMISGYRVLRLAASEVLADARYSLEKLRKLTRTLAGDP